MPAKKGIKTKEDLIEQLEKGKGLEARIGKRELEYVKCLWKKEE